MFGKKSSPPPAPSSQEGVAPQADAPSQADHSAQPVPPAGPSSAGHSPAAPSAPHAPQHAGHVPAEGEETPQYSQRAPSPAGSAPTSNHSAPTHDQGAQLPAVTTTVPTVHGDAQGAGGQQTGPDGQALTLQEQQQSALAEHRKTMEARARKKTSSYTDKNLETPEFSRAKRRLSDALIDKIDYQKMEGMSDEEKRKTIDEVIDTLIQSTKVPLTQNQHSLLKKQLLDEVLGFGPLEVLLADPEVSDIMVNGASQVYIEKAGKISMSDVVFNSEAHLLNIIQKVVQRVGRRVDETSPMVDARMPDGSRFNAIIPPLALDGSLVSIRKFKQNKMPLSQYVDYGSATPEMVRFLEICGAIRLNILISGGTGSGKTTLLNAMSGHINEGERVITIEDAAELQMHQPHVLRLETRPPNTEGVGEITQRALVKNALRMRPDRIILGEIRGDEVIDVLQAMNTGHDGSMATIHANNPRECLTRLENLFGLSGLSLPLSTLRNQVAGAVQLIIQISRMRDGGRRITQIEEVVGMEGDMITTQTIFKFKPGPIDDNGKMQGQYICNQVKPRFIEQASYYGLDKEMAATIGMGRM